MAVEHHQYFNGGGWDFPAQLSGFAGNGDPEKEANAIKFAAFVSGVLQGGHDSTLLNPTTPFSVEKALTADANHKLTKLGVKHDGYIRMTHLAQVILGAAFTLLARIIRIIVRTLFLPFSLLLSAYQQSQYAPHMKNKPYNIVVADLERYGYEWIDLATTIGFFFISAVNFFVPEAINADGMRKYYLERNEKLRDQRKVFKDAATAYDNQKTAIKDAAKIARDAGELAANTWHGV